MREAPTRFRHLIRLCGAPATGPVQTTRSSVCRPGFETLAMHSERARACARSRFARDAGGTVERLCQLIFTVVFPGCQVGDQIDCECGAERPDGVIGQLQIVVWRTGEDFTKTTGRHFREGSESKFGYEVRDLPATRQVGVIEFDDCRPCGDNQYYRSMKADKQFSKATCAVQNAAA